MAPNRWYVTSAIPYVNAAPHLGHALEFVQADALARWRRSRGDEVRSLRGTDDHAAKNVQAAAAAGEETQAFVDRHAVAFERLSAPLQLADHDFIRTSRDPRHRPAVERLWAACAASGDLYRDRYEGLYCLGCERFYTNEELTGGRCPEHDTPPERVVEENWFFRLSRYAAPVAAAIRSGRLRVEPAHRRNEILSFLDGDVRDVSVSRPASRSAGWGIRVPGDADQVIYIWFDALTNYLSALGYGEEAQDHDRWWRRADRRVHVIGKGILRFHAAYWPAFLLSAGEELPTDVLVHEYVTVDAAKISKSAGTSVAPTAITDAQGSDALRWWLLRDVTTTGDTDFRLERLIERHDQDLANAVGNLVSRLVGLIQRHGQVPSTAELPLTDALPTTTLRASLPDIDAAVDRLDHRRATGLLVEAVTAANRYVNVHRPWDRDAHGDDAREVVLGELLRFTRELCDHLAPFLPHAAEELRRRLASPLDPSGGPVFPRLDG